MILNWYFLLFVQVNPVANMEPQSQQHAVMVENLVPKYFNHEDQALGISAINQYIYVFFPQKIRVYEQLSAAKVAELVEQIYLPKKNIKLFAISQEFIAVIFDDHGLEVRLREYWEVVQYSTTLPQDTPIKMITLSGKKLIYQIQEDNLQEEKKHYLKCSNGLMGSYGFIDVYGKQGIKTWENCINIQKLIHKDHLYCISDFYLTLHKNKVKFGMFYINENKFEPYDLGELPPQSQHIVDIQLIQRDTWPPKTNEEQGKDCINNSITTIYILKILKSTLDKNLTRFKLKYRKLWEYKNHQNNQGNHEEKMYRAYDNIQNSIQQISQNCFVSAQNDAEIEKMLQFTGEADCKLEKIDYKREKSLLYISLSDRIIQIDVKNNEFIVSKVYHKIKKEKLLSMGQNFAVFATQAWSISQITPINSISIEASSQKAINQKINGNQNINDEEKDNQIDNLQDKQQKQVAQKSYTSKSSQTDTLDQFDQKYMNQIIDKLFERKKVCDYGTQTLQSQNQKEEMPQAEQNAKDFTQSSTNTENQENKSKIIIEKKTLIKYYPNEQHNTRIQKLNKTLKQLDSSIEISFSRKITEYLQKQSDKVKDQCSRTLKKICEEQINTKMVPSIQKKLGQIFQNKLNQINQYIYSLSIENLLNLRDEFEKDKINETMLQNQLMKKQLMEIEEYKKVVKKMMEVCKIRQCQKNVFFNQIKSKFIQIDQRVNSLHTKVAEIVAKEDDRQSNVIQEIEIIKDLLKLKHVKRDRSENSQQDSEKRDQNDDKEESQQAQIHQEIEDSSSSDDMIQENQILPIQSYHAQTRHAVRSYPQQQQMFHQPQRFMTPPGYMGYPQPQFHNYQAYQPYHPFPQPFSYGYPGAVQTPIPFYSKVLEPQYIPDNSQIRKKKPHKKTTHTKNK